MESARTLPTAAVVEDLARRLARAEYELSQNKQAQKALKANRTTVDHEAEKSGRARGSSSAEIKVDRQMLEYIDRYLLRDPDVNAAIKVLSMYTLETVVIYHNTGVLKAEYRELLEKHFRRFFKDVIIQLMVMGFAVISVMKHRELLYIPVVLSYNKYEVRFVNDGSSYLKYLLYSRVTGKRVTEFFIYEVDHPHESGMLNSPLAHLINTFKMYELADSAMIETLRRQTNPIMVIHRKPPIELDKDFAHIFGNGMGMTSTAGRRRSTAGLAANQVTDRAHRESISAQVPRREAEFSSADVLGPACLSLVRTGAGQDPNSLKHQIESCQREFNGTSHSSMYDPDLGENMIQLGHRQVWAGTLSSSGPTNSDTAHARFTQAISLQTGVPQQMLRRHRVSHVREDISLPTDMFVMRVRKLSTDLQKLGNSMLVMMYGDDAVHKFAAHLLLYDGNRPRLQNKLERIENSFKREMERSSVSVESTNLAPSILSNKSETADTKKSDEGESASGNPSKKSSKKPFVPECSVNNYYICRAKQDGINLKITIGAAQLTRESIQPPQDTAFSKRQRVPPVPGKSLHALPTVGDAPSSSATDESSSTDEPLEKVPIKARPTGRKSRRLNSDTEKPDAEKSGKTAPKRNASVDEKGAEKSENDATPTKTGEAPDDGPESETRSKIDLVDKKSEKKSVKKSAKKSVKKSVKKSGKNDKNDEEESGEGEGGEKDTKKGEKKGEKKKSGARRKSTS